MIVYSITVFEKDSKMYHFTTFWRENSKTWIEMRIEIKKWNLLASLAILKNETFLTIFKHYENKKGFSISKGRLLARFLHKDSSLVFARFFETLVFFARSLVSSRALRRLCLFASKQETASLKSCIFQYTLDLRIITLSKVCSLCRFASQDPKLMFSFFCAELLFLAKALFS